MTRENQYNVLILIAIGKLFSDQSTFLINELRHEKKQKFNLAVKSIDMFIKEIETGLGDFNKETLQILTDSLNDGISDLRKQLIESK
jgi:hypothetical protein